MRFPNVQIKGTTRSRGCVSVVTVTELSTRELSVAQKPVVQVPVDMVWHWQDDAACRESDVSTFFHPSNARGRERTTRERAAKSICLSCVVRTECADYAIRSREPY